MAKYTVCFFLTFLLFNVSRGQETSLPKYLPFQLETFDLIHINSIDLLKSKSKTKIFSVHKGDWIPGVYFDTDGVPDCLMVAESKPDRKRHITIYQLIDERWEKVIESKIHLDEFKVYGIYNSNEYYEIVISDMKDYSRFELAIISYRIYWNSIEMNKDK